MKQKIINERKNEQRQMKRKIRDQIIFNCVFFSSPIYNYLASFVSPYVFKSSWDYVFSRCEKKMLALLSNNAVLFFITSLVSLIVACLFDQYGNFLLVH